MQRGHLARQNGSRKSTLGKYLTSRLPSGCAMRYATSRSIFSAMYSPLAVACPDKKPHIDLLSWTARRLNAVQCDKLQLSVLGMYHRRGVRRNSTPSMEEIKGMRATHGVDAAVEDEDSVGDLRRLRLLPRVRGPEAADQRGVVLAPVHLHRHRELQAGGQGFRVWGLGSAADAKVLPIGCVGPPFTGM